MGQRRRLNKKPRRPNLTVGGRTYSDVSGMTTTVLAEVAQDVAAHPEWRIVTRERLRLRRAGGSSANRYLVIVRDLTTGSQAEITGRDTWAAWKDKTAGKDQLPSGLTKEAQVANTTGTP